MHTKNHPVTGVFPDRETASMAVHALQAAGFTDQEIGLVGPDRDGLHLAEKNAEHVGETYAGEGALTGVAAGVGIGALWGLGILAGVIPAIGPAIAGGTLAVMLSSAAAGAAAAGVGGALLGMGIPKEEADYYESEILAGNTIITVAGDERRSEAREILQRFGGQDMAARVAATMQSTDHGEPVIAPPSGQAESSRGSSPHLDFTSKLPISPADAQEELTGFSSHVGTAPVSSPPIAPSHVSFEMPVANLDDAPPSEEANMPPISDDEATVVNSPLTVEKLPSKRG